MSGLMTNCRALLRAGTALSTVALSLSVALPLAFAAPAAQAQEAKKAQEKQDDQNTQEKQAADGASGIALPELAVDGALEPETPATVVLQPHQDGTKRLPADLGALLSEVEGVTASRMGRHASDIVIRGQSQDRLAVINDGAYAFGGCPNRMDPPTSLVPESTVDLLTVQRGYQTVTNGAPAPAGSVIVERTTPQFDAFAVHGSVAAGIEGNGLQRQGSASVTAGVKEGYIRAFTDMSRSGNYKDGKGVEVRSGYESLGGGLELGVNVGENTQVSFGADRMDNDNVLFAGAGMDGVSDGTTTYRMTADHQFQDAGALQEISLNLYGSLVDHVMDNYSLRTPTGMKMVTNSTSNTFGGSLSADWNVSGVQLTTGIDHRTNIRDATSQSGAVTLAGDPSTISGYMWPDVSIMDTGLFAEAKSPLGAATTLTAGARLDRVEVDADKADAKPQNANPAARTLYRQYYGVSDVTHEEYNLSGLARLDHDFGPLSGWAGVSRSVRTADATERGIARSAGASSWVGNPNLDPEKHYQVDAGLAAKRHDWSASSGVWYDRVEDFITRDTARGQSGVLMSNGASIFRNVDAQLAGVDLSGAWMATPALKLSANMTYTYGSNLSDDRPLYQIPPLQGMVEAAYTIDSVTFGPRLRWATTQTRVDNNTATGAGLDVQKTSGYGVVDLFATWQPLEAVQLRAGVNNLFDHTYANHLNRASSFDPTMAQVNEMGRSVSVGGRVTF